MRSRKKSTRGRHHGVTRRDMIRWGVASALGVATLGPLGKGILQSASGTPAPDHRRCIVISCFGGYDGLQLVVPHGIQAYYDRRPTIALDAGDTLDFGKSGYGLHPALTNVRDAYLDGDVAIIQKVGYPKGDQSHFESQNFYSWGVRHGFGPLGVAESGWIARFADAYTDDELGACAIGIGRPLDMEGGQNRTPFMAQDLSSFDFDVDSAYEANHALRIETVGAILNGYSGGPLDQAAQAALRQGHDLSVLIQDAVDDFVPPTLPNPPYPQNFFGRYMADIARMIQAGFDTKLFFTGLAGFDNHSNLLPTMAYRLSLVDGALGAFIAHCKEMSIWDDTLILIESEFGRRIFENGSNGTDHGKGNCFFALGGGVTGGTYGPDLSSTELTNDNVLSYAVDFRDIRKEMVNKWFGGDGDLIFPEPQPINTAIGYL